MFSLYPWAITFDKDKETKEPLREYVMQQKMSCYEPTKVLAVKQIIDTINGISG